MDDARPNPRLHDTAAALRRLVPKAEFAAALEATSEQTAHAIEALVLREVEAFSASANPDVLPELRRHLTELVAAVCGGVRERRGQSFGFVREHAERRAGQRFPLEALLHAYRCAERVLSAWLRDTARAVAAGEDAAPDVAAEYVAEFAAAAASAAAAGYVQRTRRLAEAEGDQRTELLNTLLSGYDESDRRTARLLRRAGYLEQRQSFCVVAARSVNPREMENPARAQRMIDAIAAVLRDSPLRTLFGVREGLAVAVISGARRASGWTAPQSLLADRILPRLEQVGPAALIGLSNDAPSTAHLRRAQQEARLALDFATVGRRVMLFAQIPFREMVVRHAQSDIQSALPGWLDELLEADRKSGGNLALTLKAYADANMNALKTAAALAAHPNTIYARMRRVASLTGKNPLRYHDLTELLLGIDCGAG